MTSIEAKREQFRKYLERCGLIDSLSKALIKLYEEQNKPDDCIRYVRKYMCDTCPDDEQFERLKHNYEQSKVKIAELEEELEKFRADIKRTPSEILSLLEEGWQALQNDPAESLLKKFFTNEILEQLKGSRTAKNATLFDCVQSGLKHHDSSVGCYAADSDCYNVFKPLFDPIILKYHGVENAATDRLQKDVDWGNLSDIGDLDPEGKYVLSTRCRIARNLQNTPFFPILTQQQFVEIEDKVRKACENLKGELAGTYKSLKELDIITQEEMVKRHVLFRKGDEYLAAAGCYRYWPTGRGIFTNEQENFIVWVNEEDHMRIMALSKGGDLGDVYKRLVLGIQAIEEIIRVERHPRYGNVTTCPSNLGTTFRASVHIRLPNLSKDKERLQEMANQLFLQIRGTSGEHTQIEEGVMDISNKYRLGHTESELIKTVQTGVLELIKAEEELE